jgi:hypothetical protein
MASDQKAKIFNIPRGARIARQDSRLGCRQIPAQAFHDQSVNFLKQLLRDSDVFLSLRIDRLREHDNVGFPCRHYPTCSAVPSNPKSARSPLQPQGALGRDPLGCKNADRGLPINTPTAGHCPHNVGTGNAAQYQAFVFNFARTWESIYLNFDLDAPPCQAHSVAFQVELLKP